jgi:hypothetical protein
METNYQVQNMEYARSICWLKVPASEVIFTFSSKGNRILSTKKWLCREANNVAHVLASHSEGPLSIVWQKEPHDFLVSVLANDVSVFDN